MALHKLTFDATDATSRAASAQVGAILYDSVNDRLGVINASQQLEVHDADVLSELQGGISIDDGGGSITVDATDLDIRDLSHTQDSIRLGDGTNLVGVTSNALDVNIAAASGLAIFAEDSVHVSGDDGQHILAVRQDTLAASTSADGDYASLKVDSVGSLYVKHSDEIAINDGGNSITVDATDLDIRDLTAASDSIESWTHDGAGNAIGSTGGSLDVNVTNSIDVDDGLANTAIKQVAETVGVAAAAIVDGADELASRKYLMIYNNGNKSVYVGDSGVTTSNGFPLFPGSILETRIGDAVDVYMIGDAAGQNVRTLQLS